MSELRTLFVATLPEREATLKRMLLSMHNQVDAIRIMLNGWEYRQAHAFGLWCNLNGMGEAVAVMLDNSLKDGAKFYEADYYPGYVIICDDDIEYPPDFVEHMITKVEEYKRTAVVTVMGKLMKPRPLESYYKDFSTAYRTFEPLDGDYLCEIIGTCGTVYHHSTCPDLNHKFFTGVNSDIYMSKYCKLHGIRPAR